MEDFNFFADRVPPKSLVTDKDWSGFFEKYAEAFTFNTPTQMASSLHVQFEGNVTVMEKHAKWLEKVAYDRNKLKEIFQK